MNFKSKDLIITKNPKSIFAESIRGIRTNLTFASLEKELKTIAITSPEMGDGKSFILANLAIAYAQEGKNVLIIDADLRKGKQHEIFGVMNATSGGYSNLILNYKETTDLEKYIQPTYNQYVDILTTGPMPPNPVELLGSENNKRLLERLKKKYDIILIDCPPVLGLSDSLIISALSNATIFVASERKTKLESLERTKKIYEKDNLKITGVVLNCVPADKKNYYGY